MKQKTNNIVLTESLKKQIDEYSEARQLSRSSGIRLIISEFFMKQGEKQ